MKKTIFSIIFLLSALSILLSNSIDKKISKHTTKYLEDSAISKIKTDENNSIIYKIDKNNFIKIYPNTEIEINNGKVDFKYGMIFHSDKKNGKYNIDAGFFLNNVWGKANYFRLKIPNNINSFEATTKIYYLDQNLTLTPTLNKLFVGKEYTYYGFFIPYSPLWLDKKIEVYTEISNNNSTICKIQKSIDIESVEWKKQTIKFSKAKSKELSTVDRKKYERERAERYAIWDENSENPFFKSGFAYPVSNYEIVSSDFGLIREWILSDGTINSKSMHLGIDFPGVMGDNVYAPADGIVRLTGLNVEYFGNMIIIDHGHSLFTDYNHLNEIVVEVGQFVKKGDLIARMGATGAATGPHLDWGSRIYGVPIDPRTFLTIDELFKD